MEIPNLSKNESFEISNETTEELANILGRHVNEKNEGIPNKYHKDDNRIKSYRTRFTDSLKVFCELKRLGLYTHNYFLIDENISLFVEDCKSRIFKLMKDDKELMICLHTRRIKKSGIYVN
jgi:hypothetical protein